jgi:glutathione peroxidase
MKLLTILAMTMILQSANSVYDFHPLTIDGKKFDFSQYKGKKILIVNVASECGNTPQYSDLETLYEKYKDKVVVIGFPANNFGQQEPGTNSDIATFCKKNYGVSFPMMSKVSVKGDDIDPLFQWLTTQPNPDKIGDIRWNFEKFLLDENGKLIHRFHDKMQPMDETIIEAINK